MIRIVTDSCSDLNGEWMKQYQIRLVPLSVFINNRNYKDGLEITTPELFRQVEATRQLPKTSAPSVADFINAFQGADEVLFIGISSQLSATVANAFLARENLPGQVIKIIDSRNLSSGIGLLVLKAADLREQGKTIDEIESIILDSIPKVHSSFVIDTLEYLYMGGRCSAMQNIVGSLLKIRPVIEVRVDGTLGVREKIRGNRKHALDILINDFHQHAASIDPKHVFITHTGCDQDANYIAQAIQKIVPIEHLSIMIAGSTIASHCGPNTIGILYLTL